MKQILFLFLFFNIIELKTLSAEIIYFNENKSDISLETYKNNKDQKRLPISDVKENTALEKAIIQGDVKQIYSLLKKAGNLSHYINASGKNLYHHLFSTQYEKIKEGFSDTKEIPTEHKKKIAEYISKFDIDLNRKSASGHSPASYAVFNNSLEDLQILKSLEKEKNKLNLQLKVNGNNLLHLAALHHSSNVTHFLLKHSKLDINEINHKGKTAIFIAAELFDQTGLRDLVDVKPKDPHFLKSKERRVFLTENNRFILDLVNKANLYAGNSANNIFEALVKSKKYSLFEYFLRKEMNKNEFKKIIDKDNHRLAHLIISPNSDFPYYLRDKYQKIDVSFLKLLHILQFSVNHTINGETPLSLSILHKRYLNNSFLIHSLDLKDLSNRRIFGQTYAMQAVTHNNTDAFQMLYDRKVDMSVKEGGQTALHQAVEQKRIHIIDVFSKDPNALSFKNDKNVSVLEMIKKSRTILNYFSINQKEGTLTKKDNFPKRISSNPFSVKKFGNSPTRNRLRELPFPKGKR